MSKAKSNSPLLLSQYSHGPFLLFTAVVSYGSLFVIVWLVRSQSIIDRGAWITGFVATVLRCIGTIFMWLIWIYKTNTNTQRERKFLAWFENSYHVFIALSLSLRVGTEVLTGQCSEEYSLSQYMTACNDFQDTHSIHPTYLITLMVLPQLAYFLIRETRIEWIALSWLIGGAVIVFCAIQMKSQVLVYPIFFYFFASLSIFYETKRQNDDVVQLVAALQATAEEVERLQEETRATELRAMIGNVAHDLKTVSLPNLVI
jgi:signal transduction histidine kinase